MLLHAWCSASARAQLRSVAGMLVLAIAQGMAMGWSSPAIASLSIAGWGPFVPTLEESSWIVSMYDAGMVCGVLASAFVFSRRGRRLTLMLGPTCYALWIVLTVAATRAWHLMLARLLAGMGQGVLMIFTPIYIGEVTTPRLRGPLVAMSSLLCPTGQLLAYVLGPYEAYWVQAVSPLPPLLVAVVLMSTWMQESPYHLAAVGKHEDVGRVLQQLRGGEEDLLGVQVEADAIVQDALRQREDAASWRETLSPPGTKRAAGIVLLLSGCTAVLGITTVLSYTQEIFAESGSLLDASTSADVVIGVKTVLVFGAMHLLRTVDRRLHYGTLAAVNGVAMLSLAAYFLAKENLGMSVSSWQWVPLCALVLYILATGLGVLVVPQVLLSELLDERAKALVAPCAGTLMSISSFIIEKNFLIVGEAVGFVVPFGFFAIANFFLSAFTFYAVPETRGKTLVEVQEMLRGRRCE